MSEKTRYFKIGMFSVFALVLLCVGLMLFGAGAFFKQAPLAFETYFDETVQGLDIGAPVKFRGVKVGEIKDIAFVKDVYEQSESIAQMKQYFEYILVRFSVNPKNFPKLGESDGQKLLDKLASEYGLRAKLVPIGISGLNYLEMNFVDPAQNPPLEIDWTPERLYIPSAHNVFMQMGNA
ncbi:MAG TPA: MlaD family protein, partial [bacterium]|nr:MlaD family protein [bacterium]